MGIGWGVVGRCPLDSKVKQHDCEAGDFALLHCVVGDTSSVLLDSGCCSQTLPRSGRPPSLGGVKVVEFVGCCQEVRINGDWTNGVRYNLLINGID